MNSKWNDWCRLCGSSGFTTKFEFPPEVGAILKISETSHKICSDCGSYISSFQEFLKRSWKIDELFNELSLENELFLDGEEINKIRAKYELEPIDFGAKVAAFPLNPIPALEVETRPTDSKVEKLQKTEVKVEPDYDSDYEVGLALQDNLFNQFSPDPESDEEPKKKILPRRKAASKSTKNQKKYEDSDGSDTFEDPRDKDYTPTDDGDKEYKPENIEEKKEVKEKKKKPEDPYKKEEAKVLPLICHVCQEDFNKKGITALDKHCKEIHNTTIEIPCICGLTIRTTNSVTKHRRKCIRKFQGSFVCDFCGHGYTNKAHLATHMVKRHTIGARHKCPHCERDFEFRYELKRHVVIHVPIEMREMKLQCPYCEKRFQRNGTLSTHIKQVHSENKDHICHICSKGFKSRGALGLHIEGFHSTSLDFPCKEPGCTVKCRSKALLWTHMETHAPYNLACPQCPKLFNRRNQLKKHIFHCHTHADLRPFKCDQCELTFKRQADAKKHAFVHGPSDQFACFWCTATFNKVTNRARHLRLYHKEEYVEWKANQKALRFDNRHR